MEIILEDVEFTTIEEMEASLKQQYPDATGWNYIFDTCELVVTWNKYTSSRDFRQVRGGREYRCWYGCLFCL